MNKPLIILYCVGVALAASAQDWPPSDSKSHTWRFEKINPDDDWTRHFRIGSLVGMNIKANFKMTGQFDISGNNPAAGIYDDGYVHVDNTGDPDGTTTYWGYDSANQISGSTLLMHSASSFSTTGNASGQDAPYVGFDLAYGDTYWYWAGAKIGWEFGFDLLPIYITDNQPMAATVNRSIYSFDTGGIVLPNAPYSGGPSGGGAPTISDTPNPVIGTDTINGIVTGRRALDVMLYSFRLGPSFYWNLGQYFGFYAGGGPAIGLVSGKLDYDETILLDDGTSAHNVGHINATKLTYGGYVNATFVFHATDGGDFYLGAQFMPMQDVSISGAGREGKLNLSGQVYFTAGINWPF